MEKLAQILKISKILPHNNADALEIAVVGNYECIIKKNAFKEGDKIVFIAPDSVLPDAEWAKIYKTRSSRVKAIRLRNVWSFGVVESLSILCPHSYMVNWEVGDDVSAILDIKKYEPPTPQDLSAKGALPFGIGRTDETRWQSVDVLPFGDICDVTLKIDGSSMTIYYKDSEFGITSRSMDLKLDNQNKYISVGIPILEKLKKYCVENKVNVSLRGELYGSGIQAFDKNPHASKPLAFALFNVLNLDTLKYEGTDSPLYFEKLGKELGIETVPIIEKGVPLTPELIKKYDEGIETLNCVPFEGVVIKLPDGSSFKVINKNYDSKK